MIDFFLHESRFYKLVICLACIGLLYWAKDVVDVAICFIGATLIWFED